MRDVLFVSFAPQTAELQVLGHMFMKECFSHSSSFVEVLLNL